MIKAIYLDLGKVLIDFDLNVAIQGLEKATSWSLPAIKAFLSGDLIRDYERGTSSTSEFHRTFCDTLGTSIPLQKFRRVWSAMFLEQPLLSESFLRGLQRKYPLHLLSNTNELHYDYMLEKYSILELFDQRVLSFQVGRMKPEQEIYRIAVERAGVPSGEVFFADDRPENVAGALSAGIQAVQFLDEAKLKQDMTQAGIAF